MTAPVVSEVRPRRRTVPLDAPFLTTLAVIGGMYVLFLIAMLAADACYTTPQHLWEALNSREIRYAVWLSLFSCTISAILSLAVAVPLGYLLARYSFPGRGLVDAILDIPIVLPPLVIGLSLLILFQTPPGRFVQQYVQITYAVPSVIIAQFAVACAFAIRTMYVTFDQISPRPEQVAWTLGCSRARAFFTVVLPEAWRGVLTAGTLSWARSLGEFGPILVFSGTTRGRTEVLSTSVYLELSIGNLNAAVAVSLLMVLVALAVLIVVRLFGLRGAGLI